jgi:hypothetical protein
MEYVILAMSTSATTVGRAQLMAGILWLAAYQTNFSSKAFGYINTLSGSVALLYVFLLENLNVALAEKLNEFEVYLRVSALGSGILSLIFFQASMAGTAEPEVVAVLRQELVESATSTEPAVYSNIAKTVAYYSIGVSLLFGTLHTLTFFDIICIGGIDCAPEEEEDTKGEFEEETEEPTEEEEEEEKPKEEVKPE